MEKYEKTLMMRDLIAVNKSYGISAADTVDDLMRLFAVDKEEAKKLVKYYRKNEYLKLLNLPERSERLDTEEKPETKPVNTEEIE